jgi:type I restriction enzyme S subunit
MTYPQVPLGRVLTRSLDSVEISPTEPYKQVTVKLYHRGVTLRRIAPGSEIGSRQYVARAGQLIISRIDARNGAVGLVPEALDGAVVTNDFWLFDIDEWQIEPKFLDYYVGTEAFVEQCRRASEGTTNRVRLDPRRFLDLTIPLPPLDEQRRIVARIETVTEKVEEGRRLHSESEKLAQGVLQSAFSDAIRSARWLAMAEVAPLVRRPVTIDPLSDYHELGIRSFGKGTFHKEPVTGAALGDKRVFHIEPGDLLFSNVFAWEGAVAVAKLEDEGRIGSHRFITCVPRPDAATAEFLRFYFLTAEGLQKLGEASPGGAGRNRTLGLQALGRIQVPVASLTEQKHFDALQEKLATVRHAQATASTELAALVPTVIRRAFRSEL